MQHVIYNIDIIKKNTFHVLSKQHISCNVWRREILFHGKPFVIQTPWLCPKISEDNHLKYIDAFLSQEPNLKETEWFQYILQINNRFKKWIELTDFVGEWFAITNKKTTQIRLPFPNFMEWYDGLQNRSDSTHIGLTPISSNTKIRFILHLSYVWYNTSDQTSGLQWNILQGQHCSVNPPNTCMFNTQKPINTNENIKPASKSGSDTRTSHPIYGTYFKMIGMGIPIPAVKQKMTMIGLDSSILDLPPNAPLPSEDNSKSKQQMIKEVKLKKTNINNKKKVVKTTSGHGISLSDIVCGLKSLRKTFIGRSKDTTSGSANQLTTGTLRPNNTSKMQQNTLLLDLFKQQFEK